MPKIKADHVIIRNEKLFCSNCGAAQTIQLPMEIPVFVAMGKAFTKSHAKCLKTYKEPVVNPSLSIEQRADFWWQHGERGISSETIFGVLSGRGPRKDGCHPWDPSDFKRCYGLLQVVPEWRERLGEMKSQSKAWSNLVDNWDKLTEMLEEMMRTNKDNGMYDFMQTLIN